MIYADSAPDTFAHFSSEHISLSPSKRLELDRMGYKMLIEHTSLPSTSHKEFYHPLVSLLCDMVEKKRSRNKQGKPLFVGLSAPMGLKHFSLFFSNIGCLSLCDISGCK